MMHRPLILALALVAVTVARDASGQPRPSVEVGLDVSGLLLSNSPELQLGPRLVVNVDGRNGVQVTVSLQKLSPLDDLAQQKTDVYLAAYRRQVHVAGPARVSAIIGGGLERTVIVVRGVTFGNPPVTFPPSRGVELLPAFTVGAVVDVRLASRVAVALESSFLMTERLGGRISGGLVVPLGSSFTRADRLPPSVPWAALDPGERAWITTEDGREVDGEVVERSAATLTVRTPTSTVAFRVDDVNAIDTTDRIRNGAVLGARIGGLGALAPSVLVTGLICSLDDGCSAREVVAVNALFIGIGTGVGAVTGALADSLRERREPLYRRGGSTSVSLAPLIGRHRLGGGAVIRW